MKPPKRIFAYIGALIFSEKRDSDIQEEYIHLDSIFICPECGDSGGLFVEFKCTYSTGCYMSDLGYRSISLCDDEEHPCKYYCDDGGNKYNPEADNTTPCPCLNNPNSIASIKRGGSDNGNPEAISK